MVRKPFSSFQITFLGTASAQPSPTRNHSSLALRLGGDVWLFDCGEATQHQLQKSNLRMGKVEKIFITHTHGDHIFGLIPLMASLMNGAGGTADGEEDPRLQVDPSLPPLEIYGPLGTRAYVLSGLAYTHTLLGSPYVVHELHFPEEEENPTLPPHPCELPGRNILQNPTTHLWDDIFQDNTVSISAGPILHSVPCVGYVVTQAPIAGKIDPSLYLPDIQRTGAPRSILSRLQQGETVELSDGTVLCGPERRPGKKVVILGDTYDPSPIAPLAMDADVLIHEATNAHLASLDSTETFESVEQRTKSRGHSTPQMAGSFAKLIRAKKLALNHFSARYPGDESEATCRVMDAIKELAITEFGKRDVVCARDLMTMDV